MEMIINTLSGRKGKEERAESRQETDGLEATERLNARCEGRR